MHAQRSRAVHNLLSVKNESKMVPFFRKCILQKMLYSCTTSEMAGADSVRLLAGVAARYCTNQVVLIPFQFRESSDIPEISTYHCNCLEALEWPIEHF